MKILQINKYLYPKGGDAICALATGDLLLSKGHEVVFWGMKDEKDPPYPHHDIFVDKIDLSSAAGIKQQFEVAGKLLYSLEAKAKIEKLIQRIGKPDIVHLHNFAHQISPSILHVFRKHKIPCVMTAYDYKLVCASYALLSNGKLCDKCAGGAYINCIFEGCVKESRSKSMLNAFEMYLHHRVLHIYDIIDAYISPSKYLKNKLEEMGFSRRIEYLPNFVCFEEYQPNYKWEDRSIVYFGRISKEKGLSTLIEAVKLCPDITLKIIGDGPLRESLESSIRSAGVNNIVFLGHMTGDNLKTEIRKSMFVVLPSEWYENNPRSIIEGFALGKPVLGSRIGGIPELVIDNETGLLFKSGDSEDLREKIRELTATPEKIIQMGKNARKKVEYEYNSNKYYNGLMRIYNSAINK
ncbi:MAG: glycosyltransferase family 4 protein [Candidatus Omnitrophota bacterium]